MKEFKDALCMKPIPGADYSGLSVRHRYCQRRDKHKGPHRSWSREWNDGDDTSRLRGKTDRSPREWQQALSVGGELAKESQIRKEFGRPAASEISLSAPTTVLPVFDVKRQQQAIQLR